MGTNNKKIYLALSASVYVSIGTMPAYAKVIVPTPSLKPTDYAIGQDTPTLNLLIPSPTLKPKLFSALNTPIGERIVVPRPRLKPAINSGTEKSLYAQVSIPEPKLKPGSKTEGANKVFEADYFAQYAPVTAADMVAQVPNFTLSEVDTKRGLGQGGVNVLINGVRLSGKDNDARSALSRIPAASVEKIEILNGARLNIPGLSGNVANIVTGQNDFSGSWKYRAEFQDRSRANIFGVEGSVSGKRGPFEYVIGFESGPFRDTEIGPEMITDSAGQIIEMRDERALAFEDNPQISAELSYTPSNGHVAHLNANYQKTNFRFEEASIQTAVTGDGTDGQRLTSSGEDGWNGEIGADYAFDLGAGNLKLIGITRRSNLDLTESFRTFDVNGNDNTEIFTQNSRSGESIARGEYSFKQDEARDWQFAVEAAFNFLEIDATLGELNANGNIIDIPFPGSSSRVEEKRAETNLTHNWSLTDAFNLQASVGVEFSELSQTGPMGLTREFVRPKGFLSTSYAVSDSLSIRTKLERSVGQLDFDTFISSVNLADDLRNAGNPEIVPAQSWDGEIELEKAWSNGVSGTLKLYGQKIEDVVDRIPLPNGGDAPGNIDNGEVLGVELIGTVLLDDFGIEGARLDLELAAEDSSVTDPLTLLDRRISNGLVSRYTIDFRHDIPNSDWAWGGNVVGIRESADYRLTQISHFTEGGPEVEAFVEHKDVMGLTVRVDVQNALSSEQRLNRDLFDGNNRADGRFIGSETRLRTAAPRYGISVSGTF